jgi:ubiquinone/menaquinone biosynthesis C-methylase UbiE
MLIRSAVGRRDSADQYLEFQRIQGHLVLRYLRKHGAEVSGKRVVDVACGHGGYSLAFREAGAAEVIALDRFPERVHHKVHRHAKVIAGDALSLPFSDASQDFIFCASLIEHVEEPRRLLHELWRTLSPQGTCYLSFPPFYSPVGGHQFKPFHLLGETVALRVHRLIHRRGPTNKVSFASAYGGWGLYPRTIRAVRLMITEAGFTIEDQSTRYLSVNFSRLPLLGETLTWHVQFLLKRRLVPEIVGSNG